MNLMEISKYFNTVEHMIFPIGIADNGCLIRFHDFYLEIYPIPEMKYDIKGFKYQYRTPFLHEIISYNNFKRFAFNLIHGEIDNNNFIDLDCCVELHI